MQKAGAVSSLPLVMQAGRIGIREARNLPWRWYLRASRSVSRRARGESPAQGFDLPGFGVARFPQPLP